MTTVSIIGSARKIDIPIDVKAIDVYTAMCNVAYNIITKTFKLSIDEVQLVSGGAAWSDHIVVTLFNKYEFKSGTLYLPCKFIQLSNGRYQYEDTGEHNWRVNPGKVSNYYHSKFKQATGIDSLNEIGQLSNNSNFKLDTSSFGFHNRNTDVAKSQYMIAFSMASGLEPNDGGTLDTWKKSTSIKKIHIAIPEIIKNLKV